MTSILTDIEVSYDGRNPYKKGRVLIELTKWVETASGYKAEISDYLYEVTVENDIEYPRKTLLPGTSKPISIPTETYNALAEYAETQFTEGMTPSEKQEMRKAIALLQYVRTDFIDPDNTKLVYDTLPSNWQLL